MPEKMKAAFLHAAHDIRVETADRPEPGPDEVLVRVHAIGVCGSDLHLYSEGRIGSVVVTEPFIIGHEAAGEVVALGPGVNNIKVGQRVSVEPTIPCRHCEACKTGFYNLCPNVFFRGTPPNSGSYAEYVTAAQDFVYPLPDDVSYVEGALLEPMAVGLHANERGEVRPGQSAVILGAGPIGLVCLQAAKIYGADQCIITDVVSQRLDLARQLGATNTLDARGDVVAQVMELTKGRGADVVFETAGVTPSIQQSVYLARKGGMVVMVGIASQQQIPVDVVRIVRTQLRVHGSFRHANQYPLALRLVSAGRVDLKSMVTHRFPFEQIPQALELATTRKDQVIKVAIEF